MTVYSSKSRPSARRSPGRRRQIALTAAAMVLLLLAGLVALAALGGAGRRWALPAATWVSACVNGPCAEVGTAPAPGDPTRVRIPAIGVDAALETLALDEHGALRAPQAYLRAGWYAGGVAPGDAGPAVIAGHVDSQQGQAVFYRLHELRSGDLVEVWRGPQWVRFRVTGSERYPKNRFPDAQVYGPTPGPELRLVTCGGQFDRQAGSYRDNIVVFAVAVSPVDLAGGDQR